MSLQAVAADAGEAQLTVGEGQVLAPILSAKGTATGSGSAAGSGSGLRLGIRHGIKQAGP